MASRPAGGKPIEWDDLDKRKFYVIGPTFFMGMRVLLHPPMLIKTRLQVQRKRSVYNGTFDAFRKVIRHEGFRGLYKGFLINTTGLVAGQAYVTTYELARKYAGQYVGENWRNFVAGAAASSVAQCIVVPVDVCSQLVMMQGQMTSGTAKSAQRVRGSSTKVVKDLWRAEGIRGFYRGFLASMITFVPNNGVWWMCYGLLTKYIGDVVPQQTPNIVAQAACGGASGFASVLVTNPLDVIRTQLQVNTPVGNAGVCLYFCA